MAQSLSALSGNGLLQLPSPPPLLRRPLAATLRCQYRGSADVSTCQCVNVSMQTLKYQGSAYVCRTTTTLPNA